MRIVVLGAGYVGLVTAAALARADHDVVCVDISQSKVEALQAGTIPFFEPGLQDFVSDAVGRGRLQFSANVATAISVAEVAFIAVGTPPRADDGDADLRYVFAAASDIVRAASQNIVIVTKSTVPVGTGDAIERRARGIRQDIDVQVVSNPEFLREGRAVADVTKPDRIVVGSNSSFGFEVMRTVYDGQLRAGVPYVETERHSAELIKYAANAFLATKIAFVNELADLCEQVGSDVDIIASAMGLDRRIGPEFLKAGPGYGGSCFPKDTMALLRTAQDHGVSLNIVQQTVASNDSRKRRLGRRIADALGGSLDGRRVAVLGVAFKADTDDIRESPALPLIDYLVRAGASVAVYDPQAMHNARSVLRDVDFADDALTCVAGADVAVFATEWREFRHLDLEAAGKVMRRRLICDLRDIVDARHAARHDFDYFAIGRPSRAAPDTGDFRLADGVPQQADNRPIKIGG